MSIIYKHGIETYLEAAVILKNPDANKLSTVPPAGTIPSDSVFVFINSESIPWRIDGRQWHYKRCRYLPNEKKTQWKKTEYRLKSNGNEVDFHRDEYHQCAPGTTDTKGSRFVVIHYYGGFDTADAVNKEHGNTKRHKEKRTARKQLDFTEAKSPEKSAVHYERNVNETPLKQKRKDEPSVKGDDSEEDYVGAVIRSPRGKHDSSSQVHNIDSDEDISEAEVSDDDAVVIGGNRHTAKPMTALPGKLDGFIRTSPIVTKKLEDQARCGMKASSSYRAASISFNITGNGTPTHSPRNRRQAAYAKEKIAAAAAHDDLYSLYAFGLENPGFVGFTVILPGLVVLLCHSEFIPHIRSLYRKINQMVWHYDTTYGKGRPFYLSTLSLRHPILEGNPTIPVIYMLHQYSDQVPHRIFYEQAVFILPDLNRNRTVIITDRDAGIRLAIREFMPNATMLFCWVHIQKNIKSHLKEHYAEADVLTYYDGVMELLHSQSLPIYNNILTQCQGYWPTLFYSWYMQYEHHDIITCAAWILQPLGLYNPVSGITNNASESINALLARILTKQDAPMTDTATALYLLSTSNLVDVQRAMLGYPGNWRIGIQLDAVGIYVPTNFSDVVDSTAISSIVADGVIPQNANLINKRKLPPLHARGSMLGLARLFLEKDRVELIKKKGVFVVTGLHQQQFLVDLSLKKCSCRRGPPCEHLIACLMMIKCYRKDEKWAQHNVRGMGKLYRSSCKKTTGTKSPPRSRIAAVNEPAALLQQPASVEEDIVALLPKVTLASVGTAMLRANGLLEEVTMYDIATLKTKLSAYELKAMTKHSAGDERPFTHSQIGWLSDKIIMEFGKAVVDHRTQAMLEPWVSIWLLDGFEYVKPVEGPEAIPQSLLPSPENLQYWSSIDDIFIPYLHNGSHYILLHLKKSTKDITVMDPYGKIRLGETSLNRIIHYVVKSLFRPKTQEEWTVTYPVLPEQMDGMNCGVFVCYFLLCRSKDSPMDINFNPGNFRSTILKSICANCQIWIRKIADTCFECKQPDPERLKGTGEKTLWTACDRCGVWRHTDCLPPSIPRGNDVPYVCHVN